MPGAKGGAKTMMSERHKHTEFLKHCLQYDDGSDRHGLHDKLSRIQHDMRIVKRAVWLLASVFIFAVVSLFCFWALLKTSPSSGQQFIVNLLYALVTGSLISIAAFVVLWILFRRKLHRRREESRQFLTRLLASRLGNTDRPPTESEPGQKPSTPPS